MKTLILNGSPRANGDTVSLVEKLTDALKGDIHIVNTYNCNISPCMDCRYCWKNDGCAINDEMQEVYSYIESCDNIVIASPIYFSELTGQLLNTASRLQRYYCARFFRNETPITKSKKGAVILVGGGDGHIEKPYETACILLHQMNCYNIHDAVYSHNTNEIPAVRDEKVLCGINSIARFFNGYPINRSL